jgi:mannose-6-phosphate isomerase-like protein (cupin superfamily)
MSYEAINFGKKFQLFDEQWQPKVVAEMNDYQFKIVRLKGDFIWHDHKNTDETIIVLEGVLRIDLRDGAVHLSAGEMFVVPKGVEHKPYAEHEVKLLLIEPRGAQYRPCGWRPHSRKRCLDLTDSLRLGLERCPRLISLRTKRAHPAASCTRSKPTSANRPCDRQPILSRQAPEI